MPVVYFTASLSMAKWCPTKNASMDCRESQEFKLFQ